jgi:hypothetical protein
MTCLALTRLDEIASRTRVASGWNLDYGGRVRLLRCPHVSGNAKVRRDRHRCRTLPTRLLEPTTPGVKSVLICGGGEAPMCGSCSDLVVEDMAAVTEARQTESNEFYLFERAAGDLLKPLRGLR